MRPTRPIALLALAALAACASSPPSAPPREMAQRILADLEAGRSDEAARRFEPVEDDAAYRDRLYPVLFDAARGRYESGDVDGAEALLRFLVEVFPDARAARQALVYTLFRQRALQAEPDPELLARIEVHVEALGARGGEPPTFVHLVAAQSAIDGGDLGRAREALGRFLDEWDGEPRDLWLYVEDLGRKLGPPVSEGTR